MKNYYRIMLGRKSIYAEQCLKDQFIGADFDINQDLSDQLPEDWKVFNKEFIPVYLKANPGKSKISAGLACGALWTIAKGIQAGDVILSPNGAGQFLIGEVKGDYFYKAEEFLPHRRKIEWSDKLLSKDSMSDALRHSAGSIGTVSNISKHAQEIQSLLEGHEPISIRVNDETIEDPVTFALEKHLEDFLVQNWNCTELGQRYDIYEEDGELVGQQYPSDTGPIDILALSKDKKEILVIELKRGRASDAVVGQILRYMGFVQAELAEPHQTVRGIIVAMEDDQRIKRALSLTPSVDFYRYEVSFRLERG